MRTTLLCLFSVSFGLTLACSDQSLPIATDNATPQGTWVSDQASLTITDRGTTIQVLASGGCVGSYGQVLQPIPTGRFSLPGTYTQLMGAYPGRVEYAAQYAGQWDGNQLTLKITVVTLPQPVGPFHLSSGMEPTWPPCLYP